MNKNLIIAIVVVILIILGVAGYMVLGKSKSPSMMSQTPQENPQNNAISSIKDAIMGGASLECDYTTPEGIKAKAYIKNGQVRSDITGTTPEQSGSSIIKDNKIYFWNEKMAVVMEVPQISVTPATGQDAMVGQSQSTMEALEQYKQYCKNAAVEDSKFILPSGVNFQDMSSVMQKAMPSGSSSMPSGVPTQYQQMMDQYMQQ